MHFIPMMSLYNSDMASACGGVSSDWCNVLGCASVLQLRQFLVAFPQTMRTTGLQDKVRLALYSGYGMSGGQNASLIYAATHLCSWHFLMSPGTGHHSAQGKRKERGHQHLIASHVHVGTWTLRVE